MLQQHVTHVGQTRSMKSWFVFLSLTHGAVGLSALCDSGIF